MYRAETVRKLPAGIYDLFTVDWMFNMAFGQYGHIGYIRECMSVYRLHSGGAWAGRKQMEQLEELKQCIDEYNRFFGFKYAALFKKQKQSVDAQIVRLRVMDEGGKNKVTSLLPDCCRRLLNTAIQLFLPKDNHRR